jgi:hypothetical protein
VRWCCSRCREERRRCCCTAVAQGPLPRRLTAQSRAQPPAAPAPERVRVYLAERRRGLSTPQHAGGHAHKWSSKALLATAEHDDRCACKTTRCSKLGAGAR